MNLDLIKQHLLVEHNLDDALIQAYAEAAETAITNYTFTNYDEANKVHNQAKLLLIGTFYANRESVVTGISVKDLPHGVSFLLDSISGVAI